MRIVNNLLKDIISVFKKPKTEVIQPPVEYKIKSERIRSGQSVFRMDKVTGEVSEVTETSRVAIFGHSGALLKQSPLIDSGYEYVVALNLKNAKKKFLSK